MALKPGEPCDSHLCETTYPCEECGRVNPAISPIELRNAIDEKLNLLYIAWSTFGPEDGYTINVLNNLMLLYDKWLD